jgi:plastocyanin
VPQTYLRLTFAIHAKINRKPGKIEPPVSHRKQRTGIQINRKLSGVSRTRYQALPDLVNIPNSFRGELVVVKARTIRNAPPAIRIAAWLAFATISVNIAGCGKHESAPSATNPASAQSPAPAAAPAIPVDMSTTGSITGTVILTGAPPPPKLIYMMAEPMCDKMHPTPVESPEVVVGMDGALANAVVYIKSGLGNYIYDYKMASKVRLSQKGCMYEPHVLALMVGQTLEVTNDDQTLHNVHAMSKINPTWNKGQASGQAPIEQTFSHEELAIPIQCNIHPWMRSYAFVFANPYFSVTPKSGKFELKNLPPGTYTIEAWQEKFGTVDQTVTLGPKDSKAISFSFNAASSSGE